MRALLATLLLTSALAGADPTPALDAQSAETTRPAALVLDGVRLFNDVEVFRLEPSDVRAEVRILSGQPNTVPTLEVAAEVALTSHLQLRLAQDVGVPAGQSPQEAATPIAIRYSLGAHQDDVTGNPAVEVEVAPRPNAPARAALRLLAATGLMPHLVVAGNGYIAQNINRETAAGVDGTAGLTAGATYAVLHDHLHLGAEGQVGLAQYGLPNYYVVLAGGPTVVGSVGPVAATLSGLFDLAPRHVGFEPMVTLSCTF